MLRCPCCNFKTIDDKEHPIVDICEVCFWQYDEIAQEHPDEIIGPNKVSLNEARENYKRIGACEERFLELVRCPRKDERTLRWLKI